jgi:hypothetical protein
MIEIVPVTKLYHITLYGYRQMARKTLTIHLQGEEERNQRYA